MADVLTEPWPLPLQFEPAIEMTDEQFARFCASTATSASNGRPWATS